MAPRTNWKGYLKLSLVSCPVALYPATATASSQRATFHVLNRSTGSRVTRQFIDAETGAVVEPGDQVKGYEVGKGEHILVEDEELAAVAIESTHTIDIDSFVPRAEVDDRYLDSPYYLAPTDRVGQEAFAIIREAMRKKGVVGIARVVLQRRERIVMLESFGMGLLAITLRYAYQVRSEAAAFEDIADIQLQQELLDLAARIIETKTASFDVTRYEDRYENALVDLMKTKQAGREVQPVATPRPANVINLMDALRRSIEAEKGKAQTSRPGEQKRADTVTEPMRRAAAAATPRDKVQVKRQSPAGCSWPYRLPCSMRGDDDRLFCLVKHSIALCWRTALRPGSLGGC